MKKQIYRCAVCGKLLIGKTSIEKRKELLMECPDNHDGKHSAVYVEYVPFENIITKDDNIFHVYRQSYDELVKELTENEWTKFHEYTSGSWLYELFWRPGGNPANALVGEVCHFLGERSDHDCSLSMVIISKEQWIHFITQIMPKEEIVSLLDKFSK